MTAKIFQFPVLIPSDGVPLAGRIYRNVENLIEIQPAIITTGAWLTVKEQMPDTYARVLAELGYTVFTFDFSGFGESGGTPRQTEIPTRKIRDIISVADFVETMSFVKPGAVGYLGICGSAQYVLAALARGARIKSFVSVAGWFHDAGSVAGFYGGAEGVGRRLEWANRAAESFLQSGNLEIAPAYENGDETAGMFFELDYYANPDRGAIPAWKNEMAVMTWLYWLTFDGLRAAASVTTPTLIVHSDGCVLPENAKTVHAQLAGKKELVWMENGTQIDFYDLPEYVTAAAARADSWFKETLVKTDEIRTVATLSTM